MVFDYAGEALKKARYRTEADGTVYAEVPGWEGVSASGKTREECRNELETVIKGWLTVKLKRGFPIPPAG